MEFGKFLFVYESSLLCFCLSVWDVLFFLVIISIGFLFSRGNGGSCSKIKSIWILNKIVELSFEIKVFECRIYEVF